MRTDQRPAEPAHHTDPPRVLIVEPDEQTRVLLGQLLADEGFVLVGSAPNYAQALVSAKSARPTVIVTELQGGEILSPDQYIEALRCYTPAAIIVHAATVPCPVQVADWRLWAAVEKGTPPGRLLRMIRAAHQASHEASHEASHAAR